MNNNKIDVLKQWLSWLDNAQFNHTTVHIPDFQQHIVILKNALIKNLSPNKKVIAASLKFINTKSSLKNSLSWLPNSNVPTINPVYIDGINPILYKDFKIAKRLIMDELIAIDANQLYKKLLLARYNNCLNFEQDLTQIIIKNKIFLDYYYRYNFQSDLDIPNNVATKIAEYLEISSIEDICNCLQDDYPRSCYEEFKQLFNKFIDNCIGDELIKFNLNQITEIDIISGDLAKLKDSSNVEEPLHKYLNNSWDYWIKGDLYSAIRELWDAFENIKTLNCLSQVDKKQYVENFIKTIAMNLFPNDSDAQDDLFKRLNAECIQLTELGNQYNIRHSEEFKINIQNNHDLLFYLIKRMNCLLELFIKHANL